MKFSDVIRGARAECKASFKAGGKDVSLLMRPLSALEETEVTAEAIKYAKKKGAEAKPGQSIYEAAQMANTLAMGCIDDGSPAEARAPFFDGGADQVLADLDTDTLAHLYERHQMWQEECSPSTAAKGPSELFELAKRLAEENDPFAYVRLSPQTRWILQRFTASLLVELRAFKPSPSLPSDSV